MSIITTDSNVQPWYYEVELIEVVYIDDTESSVLETIPTERLTSFSILEDYETMYFPLFSVVLSLEPSIYYNILKYKDNCKIHLRIDKFPRKSNSTNKLLRRSFINNTYTLILDDTDIDLQEELKQLEYSDNYKNKIRNDENDPNKMYMQFKCYLFPESIDGTKKNVNKVFTNCTVADVCKWLLYNANINNTLMSQPDNTTIYDEIIIPPLSTLKALSFIDTYYGIYKRGSIMYFGLWYNYIIPYSGDCPCYLPDKLQEVDIIIPSSTTNTMTGVLANSGSSIDYVIGSYMNVGIINSSISNDYLNANNIQSVDSYEAVTKVLKSGAKHRRNSNFIKFFENHTENENLPYAYVAQTNALSDIISLEIYDADASLFLPYKKYNILFEDSNFTSEYSGKYILSSITHNFISSGTELSVSSSLSFKKDTLEI